MPKHPEYQRRPTRWLLLLATSALACSGGAAETLPAAAPHDRGIPVTLAAVTETTLAQPIVATGVLGAKEEIPLGFKIGGVVARVLVDAGESVRAGQLLAELEQPEIGAEVAKAEAGVVQAERDYTRATALYRDSVIARDRFEAAETGIAVARANLRIARFNEQYATIRAPATGTILRRLAEPGQQISNGAAVVVLGSRSRGQVVRVGLPDRELARVRVGDRAEVRFEADAGRAIGGRVTRIAAAASPGSGAWEVEVLLITPPPVRGGVASGLIGRVEIQPRRTRAARVVPIEALLEGDGDSAVVYSVDAVRSTTVARRHLVHVAFLQGDRAAIASGLDGVNDIVTAGAGFLSDGATVTVVSGRESRRSGPAGGVP